MAIKALDLKGEIITSAFTWIATVSAIKWQGCLPVFCDIDPETLNINPREIEKKITKNTVGIMPIHVFGNPCNIDEIEKIAKTYNLKIIYDAAHAIGSLYKGKSVLQYGDISATSLHATKILNSGEGGGCSTLDSELNKKLKRIRFFGHNDDKSDIIEDGFNGKMTEVHAALGLANIKYYEKVLIDRRNKYIYYKTNLDNTEIRFQKNINGETNHSYFPIIFKSEKKLLSIQEKIRERNIFPRRYFYPSVNMFTKILNRQSALISENISKKILCLPLYYSLDIEDMNIIIDIINNN